MRSTNVLPRVLLRSLWRLWDAGGISYKRSLRCALLEYARDILPPATEFEIKAMFAMYDLIEWKMFDIIHRERSFAPQNPPTQIPFTEGPEWLQTESLAYVLIVKLLMWFEEPERREDWVPSWEHSMCVAVLRMYTPEDNRNTLHALAAAFSYEELLRTGEERERFIGRKRRLKYEREELGIFYP